MIKILCTIFTDIKEEKYFEQFLMSSACVKEVWIIYGEATLSKFPCFPSEMQFFFFQKGA